MSAGDPHLRSDAAPFGRLNGRHALITGAGSARGIGFAAASTIGALGARVTITATSDRIHERAAELRARGVDASALVADLTDAAQVAALLDAAGDVDVLVNNAGMGSITDGSETGTLARTDEALWNASLDRNLTSAYRVTRPLVQGMAARGWGRVVMVSSVTGPVVAYPGDAAYAAAKAGMAGLARALAVEVAGDGVTVNIVAPGWIDTDGATDEERRLGRATPTGRPGRADEVGDAIAWLCTPSASYVTGALLVVDGGNTVQDDKRLLSD